jgi:spermidine synthase
MREARGSDDFIELFLYQGRLQLATRDALYSDGVRYLPAKELYRYFNADLPLVEHVLVLGTGLASIVHVFAEKGYKPHFTLVETDKQIQKWAMEYAPEGANLDPICADAGGYVESCNRKFDLIFIDIFNGRCVPPFVFSDQFLNSCKDLLEPDGHIAMNYMVNDWNEWLLVQRLFGSIFPGFEVLKRGENRLLVK